MVIGVLEMQLSMPGNRSLKDKRQVLKSVKDRVRAAFNVSIAASETSGCEVATMPLAA